MVYLRVMYRLLVKDEEIRTTDECYQPWEEWEKVSKEAVGQKVTNGDLPIRRKIIIGKKEIKDPKTLNYILSKGLNALKNGN